METHIINVYWMIAAFWERQIVKVKTWVSECIYDSGMSILLRMESLYRGIVIRRVN